jgi:hypothetical protein
MKKQRSILDRTFADSTGKIVIGQYPNTLFWTFILLGALSFFLDDTLGNALFQTGKAALFGWAYLEILSGVNYFRKIYGLTVMGLIVYSYF